MGMNVSTGASGSERALVRCGVLCSAILSGLPVSVRLKPDATADWEPAAAGAVFVVVFVVASVAASGFSRTEPSRATNTARINAHADTTGTRTQGRSHPPRPLP